MNPDYMRRYKSVHIFLNGISSKVRVIEWLKSELAYYDVAVQHINHYTIGGLPHTWVSIRVC